jgi:hypothetical protein
MSRAYIDCKNEKTILQEIFADPQAAVKCVLIYILRWPVYLLSRWRQRQKKKRSAGELCGWTGLDELTDRRWNSILFKLSQRCSKIWSGLAKCNSANPVSKRLTRVALCHCSKSDLCPFSKNCHKKMICHQPFQYKLIMNCMRHAISF